MHSRGIMLFSGMAAILSFMVAGSNAAHGHTGAAMLLGLFGVVAMIQGYGREKMLAGAEPLTRLEPGREYRVEGILPDKRNANGGFVARVVVSWHVAMGRIEYRIAHLNYADITGGGIMVGTRIQVVRSPSGGLRYTMVGPSR